MKGRQQLGQKDRPALPEPKREEMIRESQACLVVQFRNNAQSTKFWSKCGQRKHRHIGDAINYLMWLVNDYKPWQGQVAKAAIFDTRGTKASSGTNKVYQYDGSWKLENPVTW